MAFTDFIGDRIKRNMDVVVTVAGKLHTGIVHEVADDHVRISYNGWHDNGEEYVREKQFTLEEYPDGQIDKICIL